MQTKDLGKKQCLKAPRANFFSNILAGKESPLKQSTYLDSLLADPW